MSGDPGTNGESDAGLLTRLIRSELVNVPVDSWGFFFPCQVAVWRFIERKRPGVFGPLKARFVGEPLFEGKGASWFCEQLGSEERYINFLEEIMYPITRDAPAKTRQAVVQRGFFRDDEIVAIDGELVERLAAFVLSRVDEAEEAGKIT